MPSRKPAQGARRGLAWIAGLAGVAVLVLAVAWVADQHQLLPRPGVAQAPKQKMGRRARNFDGLAQRDAVLARATATTALFARVTSANDARFVVWLNGQPVLERFVTRAHAPDREGRLELGALHVNARDRLELTGDGPAAEGAKLLLAPFSAEDSRDRTTELRAAYGLVFRDDFDILQTTPGPSGALWSTSLKPGGRIHASSPDSFFSDADFGERVGAGRTLDPFSIRSGVLSIRGGEIPKTALPAVRQALGDKVSPDDTGPNALRYYSGSLSSHSSWSQTYGYFEMRAKLPRGDGFWPTFWLTASVGWPPEIDALEAIYHEDTGAGVNQVHSALHYKHLDAAGNPVAPKLALGVFSPAGQGPDLYDALHLYAVQWTPDWVSVFLDGRLIFKAATPEQMRRSPMIVIASLQLGSETPQPRWATDIKRTEDLRNSYDIDFIAVYRAADDYPSVGPGADGSVVAPAQAATVPGFTLLGDERDNRIQTGAGLDVVRGGKGADTIEVSGRLDAHKIVEDFRPAEGDRLVLRQFPFQDVADALDRSRQMGADLWIMTGAQPIAPQTIILKGLTRADVPASALVVQSPRRDRRRGQDGSRPLPQPPRQGAQN